jgi:hypothetical protein
VSAITKKTMLAVAAFLIAAGPALSAPGDRLSWFNDTPFAGVGNVGVPEVSLRKPETTPFGLDVYRSQRSAVDVAVNPADTGSGADRVHLYGELESTREPYRMAQDSSLDRLSSFGVKWQHSVNALHSFAVSAEYGEGTAIYPSAFGTQDTRAAFSWTSRLLDGTKPSLTGSVFVGDEMGREDIYRSLGRKYYGFTVGGSMTLFDSHTPYVSFKMQRGLYDTVDDPTFISPRSGDRSLLSAGWKWQVQRDFSLQAEASYGLNNYTPNPELYVPERSRVFFGTRFDFK